MHLGPHVNSSQAGTSVSAALSKIASRMISAPRSSPFITKYSGKPGVPVSIRNATGNVRLALRDGLRLRLALITRLIGRSTTEIPFQLVNLLPVHVADRNRAAPSASENMGIRSDHRSLMAAISSSKD